MKSSKKNALWMSALSLVLCVSMLVGTTFAWFTDSVTSANNIIKSGNLDLTLEYLNGSTWTDVQGSSEILDKDALWEPGYTEVAYLRLKNAGSLALKYQFAVNVVSETEGVNAAGETFKLSDYIHFDVVDAEVENDQLVPFASRELAVDAIENDKLISANFSDAGTLEADSDYVYLAMVVYMPESVGNEANHNGVNVPSIKLGITALATQMMAEEDSFGADYDKDSAYPKIESVEIPAGTTEETTIANDIVSVDVPAGAEAGNYTLEVSNVKETEENGKTSISMNIDLKKDGVKVSGSNYEVRINIGKNLDVDKVLHNGEEIAFSYDPTEGYITFVTDGFSPFEFIYSKADAESVFVPSDAEAAEKLEKDSVVAVDENGNEFTSLTAAVKSGAEKLYCKEGADLGTITHLDLDHDLVIYGNGAFISAGERDFAIDTYVPLTDDITVTVYNLHGVAFWGQRNTSYTFTLNLYNCNDLGRVYINGTNGKNNINIYGCSADKSTLIGDTVIYSNANGELSLKDCTFVGIGCPVNLNHKVAGEQTVTVIGCTFKDCATEGTAAYYAPIRLYNSAEGANQTLTVAQNSFLYSEGKAAINNADVLLNAKHNGADAIGTIKASVQLSATTVCGKNVSRAMGISTADELAALNTMFKNKTAGQNVEVEILADIDFAGKTWTAVDSHVDLGCSLKSINGNGHTIKNLSVNGQAMFTRFAAFGDVTIKDLTFDGAVVSSTSINTAILVGQTYQNVLLENVDVKNSAITGGYKVATLIGTVYNEASSTITATLKGCDVENTVVTALYYDFCTTGMVAFVYADDNDKIVFENCSVKDVSIYAPNSYTAHAWIYTTGSETLFNEAEGVIVSGCTFENK